MTNTETTTPATAAETQPMPALCCLPNLSVGRTFERTPPYNDFPRRQFEGEDPHDPDVRKRWKKKCADPNFAHCFFSGSAGLNPGLRITQDNPPAEIRAFVLDYDSKVSPTEWPEGLRRFPEGLTPTYLCRTFSGGVRAVWLLTRAVPVSGVRLYCEFLKLASIKVAAKGAFPALDKAVENAGQYWEAGTDWQKTGELLDADTVAAWLIEAGNRTDFSDLGVAIPLEVIAAEVEARFPGRWKGPFEEGCRGVRFWEPMADNPSAAVVRKEGMQTFTGANAFVPWVSIFGPAFVRQHTEAKLGNAVSSLYFCGNQYYRLSGADQWLPHSREDTAVFLRQRGLSKKASHNSTSQVENGLLYIQEHNRVDGVAPLVFCADKVATVNGMRVLNTSTLKALPPAEKPDGSEPLAWGEEFPFIAQLLDTYFSQPAEHQLSVFLAWLKRFYAGAVKCNLSPGQALFIGGPPEKGKTLLANEIVGGLVGGSTDPSAFLLGTTAFNKELGERALWTVNDIVTDGGLASIVRLGEQVKTIVSDAGFMWQSKFRDQMRLPFRGRIVVTFNLDEESLRVVPPMEPGFLDKVHLLHCSPELVAFPPKEEIAETLQKELPYFGRYLLDYEVPESLRGRSRFGIGAFHHSALLCETRATTPEAHLADLLETLAAELRTVDKGREKWEGPTSKLWADMERLGLGSTLARTARDTTHLGRQLSKLSRVPGSRVTDKRKPPSGGGTVTFTIDLRERAQEDPPAAPPGEDRPF